MSNIAIPEQPIMEDPIRPEIPEDERDPILENLVPATKSNKEYALRAVVGKVISDRVLNKKAVINIMFKTWESYKGMYITEMTENKFLFTFPSIKAAEEVLKKTPWFVMNQLLNLQRWGEGITFENIDFSKAPFWIQIHGLASHEVNPENAPIILNKVGRILEVDDPLKTGDVATYYLRARVAVDVTKPLWSGCWLQKPGSNRSWVQFRYERLQGICYKCGKFGHDQKSCELPMVMAANNKQLPKYGSCMNASKPRSFQNLSYDEFKRRSQAQQQSPNANECGSSSGVQPERNNEEPAPEVNEQSQSQASVNRNATVDIQENNNVNNSNNNSEQVNPTTEQPRVIRVFKRLPCKDFILPPRLTPPPYYVVFPPENESCSVKTTISVPDVVEETLSAELASCLSLKRDREPVNLSLTNGGEEEVNENDPKKARLVAVIDGEIILETIEMVEEAGLPMPPMIK